MRAGPRSILPIPSNDVPVIEPSTNPMMAMEVMVKHITCSVPRSFALVLSHAAGISDRNMSNNMTIIAVIVKLAVAYAKIKGILKTA